MSDGVPSDYCPPAEPSEYLESGVQYPTPEGKEWKESVDPEENDLSGEAEKQNKNTNGRLNLTGSSSGVDINKTNNRLESELGTRATKRTSTLGVGVTSGKRAGRISLASSATRKGSLPI